MIPWIIAAFLLGKRSSGTPGWPPPAHPPPPAPVPPVLITKKGVTPLAPAAAVDPVHALHARWQALHGKIHPTTYPRLYAQFQKDYAQAMLFVKPGADASVLHKWELVAAQYERATASPTAKMVPRIP